MKKLKLILAGMAALTMAVSMSSCGDEEKIKEIELNQYVKYDFEGYSSSGECRAFIDYDQLVEDNYRTFDLKKDHTVDQKDKVVQKLRKVLDGELDKPVNLSNGDEITYVWRMGDMFEDFEDDYSIDFSYTDVKISVAGLDEIEKYDPFEGVEVKFEGTEPKGRASFDNGDIELRCSHNGCNFKIRFDKIKNLSNGDKVVVKLEDYADEEEFAENGFVVEPKEKEFTVDGLDAYATKLADIPKSDLEIMDKHNVDLLNEHIAQKWVESESCKGIELVEYLFLTPKDGIDTDTNNGLYYVYRVDVENSEGALSYYYYTYYSDILITTDGKCSYDLNAATYPQGGKFGNSPYGEAFLSGSYYYLGYQKLEDLYNQKVTTVVSKYNCEEVSAEKAAETEKHTEAPSLAKNEDETKE